MAQSLYDDIIKIQKEVNAICCKIDSLIPTTTTTTTSPQP